MSITDNALFYIGLIIAAVAVLLFIIVFFVMRIKWISLNHQLDFEYGESHKNYKSRKVKR